MKLYNEKCLDVLRTIENNSIDAVITDPPYGLNFMGKKWDYQVPTVETWKEVLRVMKPGSTLLCFAGTRTQHRMAVNIEDAGFILKDTIMWLYGSGFPKATDIGKQLDKNTTDEAKKWDGWKSHGLKPAYEPIIMAMKSNEGSYAENALKWGVGGINIDECRISTVDKLGGGAEKKVTFNGGGGGWHRPWMDDDEKQKIQAEKVKERVKLAELKGRYPANIIFSHHPECEEKCHEDCPIKQLDEQSGILKSGFMKSDTNRSTDGGYHKGFPKNRVGERDTYGDEGGASRFFYCAKAGKKERNIGVDNKHPTVKPIKIMEYLCKMVSMPDKITVLDPYMGSGTTGIACMNIGLDFIGIEKELEYFEIAQARLNYIKKEVIEKPKKTKEAVNVFFDIGE